MTDQLPEPLTPADCDLRDFAFMPLDVVRLRDSDLAATESAEAFRAAVLLWCASWHQLPAASLPDDDRVLANLAGYGRVVKEWQKEREGALRGWVKCEDGRMYHPVVAEKAVEAWRSKLEQRWRTEAGRVKKHNQRHKLEGAAAVQMPDFETWLSQGRPQGQHLHVPGDKQELSPGQVGDCPSVVPREMPSKGQGERQGQGQGQGSIEYQGADAPLPTTLLPAEDLLPLAAEPDTPACPVKHLVGLFALKCPTLPKPRLELFQQGAGAEAMRQRWKWLLTASREDDTRYATTREEGVAWFTLFFETVNDSDFLSGRAGRWKADLAWLMKRENFTKVVQGNYTNREHA